MSHELPPKSEVMEWSPHQLADFLKRRDLSGCDKTVLKNMMNGSRFLNLSDNDLQRFPKVHAPLISKLSSDINKKEERRGGLFSKRSTAQRYADAGNQRFAAAGNQMGNHSASGFSDSQVGWAPDEFEDSDWDEDPDYENPDADDEPDEPDYESPTEDDEPDYEPPPSEPAEDPGRQPCPALPLGDGDYIDSRPATRPSEPTLNAPRPAVEPSPPPPVFRNQKPALQSNADERVVQTSLSCRLPPCPVAAASVRRSKSSVQKPPSPWCVPDARNEEDMPSRHNTFPLPNSHNKELPTRPLPTGTRNTNSLPPCYKPDVNFLPGRNKSVMGVQRSQSSVSQRELFSRPSPPVSQPRPKDGPQGMDGRWYVGRVNRYQAEGCLRQFNKDGAYVVRDSKHSTEEQPYTLMVLYQGHVFNIQIRRQGGQYLLGTGLKIQEPFLAVGDIISHYSQNPLLLIINEKIRGSGPKTLHCQLSDPAGHCVTRT